MRALRIYLLTFVVLLSVISLPVVAQSPDWVWVRRYVYDLRTQYGELVATDYAGNVYVAGYTGSADWRASVLLLKYSAEGELLWQRTYSLGELRTVTPVDMKIDAAGNVHLLVGGQYFGSFLILKFDSNGNLLWVQSYAGPGGGFANRDVPYALALDHAGNVYAVGTSVGYWSGPDITVLKYTASGQPQWVRRYSANLGASSDSEAGTAIACDTEGNVYVAGWTRPTYPLHEWIIVKYNTRGDELWAWRESFQITTSFSAYVPLRLRVDNTTGGIYVAGDVQGACVALRLDPDGNRLWRKELTVSGVTLRLGGAEMDSAGNLLMVGFGDRLTGTRTAVQAVFKLSPDGSLLWSAQDEAPNFMQSIDGVAIDPSDQLWVTGTRSRDFADRTILLWQWNENGQQVRQIALPSSPHLANWAADVAADGVGNVVVAGFSNLLYTGTSGGPTEVLVAKYGASTGLTLQGRVILGDVAIRFPAIPVEVELRQGGVVLRRDEVYPDENGNFTLYNAPEGIYDVAFRGMHWLRRVVPQVAIAPGAPEVEVYLVNGDIDGDNEVTLFDFGLLVQAFGSNPDSPNWNINADLDMDAEVTLFDFAVIVFNFGEIGDE